MLSYLTNDSESFLLECNEWCYARKMHDKTPEKVDWHCLQPVREMLW